MENIRVSVSRSVGPLAPRGRPRSLSRDAIIDSALALLEAQPAVPLSLNAVARALGVTPMAIYTYFASKDELFQAVTDRLLADFAPQADDAEDPIAAIADWAHAMRRHFLKHPQLIGLLVWEGGHSSIAWIKRGMVVFDALAALGFEADEQGVATLWLWHVVMGAINAEINGQAKPQSLSREELASIEPALRAPVDLMLGLAAAPDHHERFFAYQVDRALDVLRSRRAAKE